MVKYTHKITVEYTGDSFLCAIVGNKVYVSPFTKSDGSVWGDYDEYNADSEHEHLTPELWFDNPLRWSVKRLNQFKGNK